MLALPPTLSKNEVNLDNRMGLLTQPSNTIIAIFNCIHATSTR